MSTPVLTLLTDYGTESEFAGVCHEPPAGLIHFTVDGWVRSSRGSNRSRTSTTVAMAVHVLYDIVAVLTT